jgi:hypothetical protein
MAVAAAEAAAAGIADVQRAVLAVLTGPDDGLHVLQQQQQQQRQQQQWWQQQGEQTYNVL